jgi:hypothetical protein
MGIKNKTGQKQVIVRKSISNKHPARFHECSSKFCIKEEIERRVRKKVEEVTLLLVQELKTMI